MALILYMIALHTYYYTAEGQCAYTRILNTECSDTVELYSSNVKKNRNATVRTHMFMLYMMKKMTAACREKGDTLIHLKRHGQQDGQDVRILTME